MPGRFFGHKIKTLDVLRAIVEDAVTITGHNELTVPLICWGLRTGAGAD